MQIISLFSGIGGFEIAAEWMGWDNVVSCEINPFGRKTLQYHFPNSYHHDDIHTLNYDTIKEKSRWNPSADTIVCGGFPCQPYSTAGKRLGKEDERHLWPEMLRVIREVKPRWVVGENVRGLVSWSEGLVFEEVCADLEAEGYEVQPFILPAAGVNAPHKRDRVWFVAFNANNQRGSDGLGQVQETNGEVPQWNDNAQPCNPSQQFTKDTFSNGRIQRETEQERAEIWEQRDISSGNSKRLCGKAMAGFTANTYYERYTSCRQSSEVERIRCGNDGKQKERRESSKRINGFYGLLRITSNSEFIRLQHTEEAGNLSESKGKAQRKGRKSTEPIETNGSGRSLADTDSQQRCEGRMYEAGPRQTERYTGSCNSWENGNAWANFPTESPLRRRDDGLSERLANFVVDEVYYEISKTGKKNRIENLQEVWQRVQQEEVWEQIRGLYSLDSKDLLFQTMQLYSTEAKIKKHLSPFSQEVSKAPLRTLQKYGEFRSSPQGQKLEKQRKEQFGNTLSFLPHEVALAARAYTNSIRKFIEWHRQESIKAYGNAIVPQVALQIFKAIQQYEDEQK